MNLFEASPAIKNTVAIAALAVGTAAILVISNKLGKHWSDEKLAGMKLASEKTLKNTK